MSTRDELRRALTEAMRLRDTAVVPHLRSAIAAIDNREAVTPVSLPAADSPIAGAVAGVGSSDVERRSLSEQQQIAIVAEEVAELASHVERLTKLCRRDEADAARRALALLHRAVDAQLSTDTTTSDT